MRQPNHSRRFLIASARRVALASTASLALTSLAFIGSTTVARAQTSPAQSAATRGGATDAADALRGLGTLLQQLTAMNSAGFVSPTHSSSSFAAAGAIKATSGIVSGPLFFSRNFPITGSSGPPPATLTSAYTDTENGVITETGNTNLNGFALTYNGPGYITAQGILSGTGAGSTVTYSGNGILTLTGANTYTGGTTVASGAVFVGVNGGAASTASLGTGNVTNNGSLYYAAASSAGTSASTTLTNNNNLYFVNSSTADSATINNSAALRFYDSATAGSSKIANTGSGSLFFYNASTADNATIVNNAGASGRLDISGLNANASLSIGSLSGSGAVYLGSHALTVGGLGIDMTISGVIQDGGSGGGTGGSLINGGNETLTLSGVNTYTGGTTFNGGVVNVSADSSLGAVPTSAATNLTFNSGTLQFGSSFTLSANRNTTFTGLGGTFDTQANTDKYGGVISGVGGLIKAGKGTLTLTGANTYTGGTTVSSGTLNVGVSGGTAATASLGTGNVTIVTGEYPSFAGGLLNFYAASSAGTSASTTLDNNNNLYFNDSSTAGSSTINNNGNLIFYDFSNAGSSTIINSYEIYFENSSTAGSSTINNNGDLIFYGFSTAGSSTINNNSNLSFHGSSTANKATIVNNASASKGLDISLLNAGAGLSIGSLSGSGAVYLGSHALTVDGLASNPSTTISGNIQDGGLAGGTGGSLIKAGKGTLTLTGANTYNGGTTVSNGTVNVGVIGGTAATARLGTGNVTVSTGGTLNFYAASSAGTSTATTLTNNNNLYFYDSSTAGGSAIANNYSLVFGDSATAGSSAITNNNFLAFSISATAGSSHIANSSGLYFLNSSTAGTSTITNSDSGALYFQDTSTANNATIVNNASASGGVDLSQLNAGAGLSIGSLSGSGSVYLGSQALTVDGLARNPSTTVSGVIQDGGLAGGTGGGLIKAGTGTLTLTGANTYTGGTTINAGSVVAGGTAVGTGKVTVASGATLGVGEALNSARTAIGTSSLSASSLAVTLGSATPLLTFNLGASGVNDVLNLTSTTATDLTYSGAGAFAIGFASATGNSLGAGTYTLINFASPESTATAPALGAYKAEPQGNLGRITGGVFSYRTNSGGSITALNFTIGPGGSADALPEPSALLLLMSGTLAVGMSGRNRRCRRQIA